LRRGRALPVFLAHSLTGMFTQLKYVKCTVSVVRQEAEPRLLDTSIPVLVVDDSATMINIVRTLLRQIGFADVDDAKDGATALEQMRRKRYGLVISDWNMEPMSGYDFLREVRRDDGLKRTLFIMITGEAKTENVIAARRAGVNNYIVKPFNAQTLKTKIESVFLARTAALIA
jgi:two-component system, chemotaxis family, chemotaxis protein CheY